MGGEHKLNPFDILLIVIFTVGIFLLCYHLVVIPELTSATPIVINKVDDPKKLSNNLIKEGSTKFGQSGYVEAVLREPCVTEIDQGTGPNLPSGYSNQTCNDKYVCTTGIVKANNIKHAGICLVKEGGECNNHFECTPGKYCIDRICREKNVNSKLNKRCNINSDCGNKNSGTVCYNERCKFKIYNSEEMVTGCNYSDDCNLYNSEGNEVTCVNEIFNDVIYEFAYLGLDSVDNHRFKPVDETFSLSGLTLNDNQLSIGYDSFQLFEVKKDEIIISNSDIEFIVGNVYNIIREEVKDKTICIVSYPIGSKLINIEGTNTPYPCDSNGISTLVEGIHYCTEKVLEWGTSGQVCINSRPGEEKICNAEQNLECLYNSELHDNIFNNYNTIGTSIGGLELGRIGKCFEPVSGQFENCSEGNENCEKPFICKQGVGCINYYDILNPPEIIGCSGGFVFDLVESRCIVDNNIHNYNFCTKNKDCFDQKICGGTSVLSAYKTSSLNFEKEEDIPSTYNNPKILMSKHYNKEGNPSAIGYYDVKEVGGKKVVNSQLKFGTTAKTVNITFENTKIEKENIRLSIFKKDEVTHQLNIEYLQKYPEYRMRKYNIVWDGVNLVIPYNYGLCQGTCIYLAHGAYESIFFSAGDLDYNYGTCYIEEWKTPRYNNSTSPFKETADRWANFLYMYVFDNGYSIYGEGKDKLLFENKYDSGDSYEITNFLNLGDKVTYHNNFSTGVSAKIEGGDNIYLEPGTCYYVVPCPDNVILVKDYHTTNTDFYVKGVSVSKEGKFLYDIDNFYEAPYLELEEKYGLNIMTYDISPGSDNSIKIDIEEKKNYFRTDEIIPINSFPVGVDEIALHQNDPIGYFSGISTLKDINTEIDENSIIVTSKLSKTANQVLNLNYSTFDKAGTEFDNEKFYSANHFNVGTLNLIEYSINNVASVPNSKVFSDSDHYNPADNKYILPYEIDRVQYYDQSPLVSDTLDFFTSFKGMSPNNPNSFLAMENKLRKTELTIPGEDPEIKYLGIVAGEGSKKVTDIDNKTFGYCSPIEMEKFKSRGSKDDISGNNYSEGNFNIIIGNQKDIDAILKYSASELVIGFEYTGTENNDTLDLSGKGIVNTWVITGIESYEIENGFDEKLVLVINRKDYLFPINYTEDSQDFTPYLFPNNIFPTSIKTFFNAGTFELYDGTAIVSSCDNTEDLYRKTSYNKILTKINYQNGGVPPDYSTILNVLFLTISENPWVDYGLINPYIKATPGKTTFSLYFSSNNVYAGDHNKIYIVNNLFTSALNNEKIYFNNYSIAVGNFVPIKFKSNYVTHRERKGDFDLKIDTIPFYSGTEPRKDDLDESFKSRIIWNYADFFKTTEITFHKMIFNYNPGNTDNNMNFYFFLENNGVKMLYFITTTTNYSIFNRPIPIILSSEEYYNNSFMTPYNNNLYMIGKTCS